MKKDDLLDLYDAVSGIDEKYIERAEDTERIAASFKRARLRRIERYVPIAASLVLVFLVSINFFDKNDRSQQFLNPESSSTADLSGSSEAEEYAKTTPRNDQKLPSSDQRLPEKTDIDDPAVPIPDITEPPAVFHENPTEPSASLTEPTEKPTEPAVSSTESPEKPTEPAALPTVPTENQPSLPPAVSTEAPDEDQTASPPDEKPLHWDEMNITQQYFMCTFENNYYKTMNKAVEGTMIGGYLGIAEMDGYDLYNDRYYHCTAKTYEIKGVSESDKVAVLFDGYTGFFAYMNYNLLSEDKEK